MDDIVAVIDVEQAMQEEPLLSLVIATALKLVLDPDWEPDAKA